MKRVKQLLLISFLISAFASKGQEIKKLEKYCNKISVDIDKFTGDTTYRTPVLKPVKFIKVKSQGTERVYMSLRIIGATSSTGKGVTLLLENGSKIEKAIKTDVKVNSSAQYEHSAFFQLTDEDIQLLKKYNLKDFRLYIFDGVVSRPVQYRAFIICLDEK